MTLTIVLKSGEHFNLANADWINFFDAIKKTAEDGNKKQALNNFCLFENGTCPMMININEIAAIYRSDDVP